LKKNLALLLLKVQIGKRKMIEPNPSITFSLLKLPERPLLCGGMNGSPERGGGTEAQVVGF